MIILLSGASHTGKTALAQRLMEKYKYPYLSIDHLKMGLIRSKNATLTPYSSYNDLTEYLWPIVREIIKTAIESDQNLIIEGCYIPFDWQKDFINLNYIKNFNINKTIKYYCLVMSENYIKNYFSDILKYANIIEKRLDDDSTLNGLLEDNKKMLELAIKHNVNYILINEKYEIDIDIL